MSTTTTATAPQEQEQIQQSSRADKRKAKEQLRQERIDALAQKMLNSLRSDERKKPPHERRTETQLWKAARAQAATDEKSSRWKAAAKDAARRAGRNAKSEARSTAHRNRKQLAPWALAAPYAALGAGGWVAVEFGEAHPVGLAAVFAATTLGAAMLTWRTWLAQRVPTRFAERLKATMALLSTWAVLMPLVPTAGQGGMWLAWMMATAYMALPWWRDHEHPLPASEVPEATSVNTSTSEDDTAAEQQLTDEQRFMQDKLERYAQHVAKQGMLPGTSLTNPQRVEYGYAFRLQLAQSGQTIDDARHMAEKIGYALNVNPASILFDQDWNPGAEWRTLVMIVITAAVPNTFDGPRIVRDGGDIAIEVGPHSDGDGAERFTVLNDQLSEEQLAAGEKPRGSMNGGFVFGTKGSGKSRFLEMIATGLRALGVEIWYLDPQQGKSSPALMAEADWPFSGVHGSKAFSNVVDLLDAVDAVCEVREAEGGDHEQGFQHTPQRPAIMVIIDECHEVFQENAPKKAGVIAGENFGVLFARLDRKMRKNGVGLLGSSQSITQNTFGVGNDAGVLRSGMCATNCFGLAYRANPALAPGYDDQPVQSLPLNRGYGYALMGERPQIRFQSFYTPDFQPWLRSYPRPVLDRRAQKRIGKNYDNRFKKVEQSKAAKQSWLDALDASDDGATLPRLGTDGVPTGGESPSSREAEPAGESGSGVPEPGLLSPAQLRQQTTQPDPDETGEAGASSASPREDTAPAVAGDAAEPTAAEQRALDLLTEESQHTPDSAGQALGVSVQAARKHLRSLAAKGLARKHGDGTYSAAAEYVAT